MVDDEDDDEEDFASDGADAGSIVITRPIGGEEWVTGSYRTIEWDSTGDFSEVVIEALKGGVAYKTIDEEADNTDSYEWCIDRSFASGDDYQIKVTSVDNPSVSWTSNMFSIRHPLIRATVGSKVQLSEAFDTKPKLFIDVEGKRKDARIVSWKNGDTTFTWNSAVAEGTYTLYAEQKEVEAEIVTDSFQIMKPTIEDNSELGGEGKYYTMMFYGITGEKPKIWWNCGDSKKLNCSIMEYDLCDFSDPDADEPDIQEYILVKFKAGSFDEYKPTTVTIKNSMGQDGLSNTVIPF